MDFKHHWNEKILVIDVGEGDGGLFCSDIDSFVEEVVVLNNNNSDRIAINMAQKKYLNSSGLGQLIRAKDTLIDKGIELILLQPMERVVSLIKMVGVEDFFHIIFTEEEL